MAKRGKKLDDKLREEIRAYLASCGNIRETARKFGVSTSTVRKIRDEKKDEFAQLRTQKKMEYIEKAWAIINLYIERVADPELIKKTNARDSAVVIGTLWDKINKEKELELKREELEMKREELALKKLELERAEETDTGELEAIAEALKKVAEDA